MLASEVSVGHSRSQPTFPVPSLLPSIPRSNALAADSSSWPLRVSDLAEVGKCDRPWPGCLPVLWFADADKTQAKRTTTKYPLDASSISLAHQFTLPPSLDPLLEAFRLPGNSETASAYRVSQPVFSYFPFALTLGGRWEQRFGWFLIDVVYMIGLLMMAGLLVSSANGRWASG